MKNQIMFAELVNGVTTVMLNDPQVRIISDAGVFLVTPKSNTHNYPELQFKEVDKEALEVYNIQF